jgi:hypothetical protein
MALITHTSPALQSLQRGVEKIIHYALGIAGKTDSPGSFIGI